MNNVTSEVTNGLLTVKIGGRVDSSNADITEQDINSALSNAHNEVVFDVENLEYISSAGLRVVLRVRKAEPTLRIINASSEVYDIFDMTGFSEMIPVEKAYRKFSVEGCQVIGQGANGKVYRLDADTIIKVYFDPDSLPDIQRERELARKAFVLGIPTAIPYDVAKVGNSYGSVFELLDATSFAELIKNNPQDVDKYVDLYVDLLKKIHSTSVKQDDVPFMKDVAVGWVKQLEQHLPSDKYAKLLNMVETVPNVPNMLHGDFHIKNVMMQNGEVLLIDMDTLCQGHPVFELAGIFNAYKGFYLYHRPEVTFMDIPMDVSEHIWDTTLQKYLETDDKEKLQKVENKAKVISLTRLTGRFIRKKLTDTPEGKAEFETYRQMLIDLIDSVDCLTF